MRYEALICDVDGTLIENKRDGMPSKALKQAIADIKDTIHFGVATGRPYLFAKDVIEALDCSGPCILGNGVQIFDPVRNEVIREHQLPTAHLPQIYEILKELEVDCIVQETENRVVFSATYEPNNPLYIFVLVFDETKAEAFLEAMSAIPDVIVHKMIAWEPGKSEYLISHAAATKQHAVMEVAQILGIDTQSIIGVGDGHNDFPLLMACGLRVAMGNAVDDLKQIADYVAPSVADDGVVDVIERFIKGND